MTPSFRSSTLAVSISPMISACAAGTSLKVRTPQPRRARRYAPQETRAQRGSCFFEEGRAGARGGGEACSQQRRQPAWRGLVEGVAEEEGGGGTYHGDDFVLDGGREGDQTEVEGEVELRG